MEALINQGADRIAVDDQKNNSLHLAARVSGSVEAVMYILNTLKLPLEGKGNNGRTALLLAAEGGHVEVMEALINQGADRIAVDDNKSNVLHLAADLSGNVNAVEYCLKTLKLPLESKGVGGQTALEMAKDAKVIELLLKRKEIAEEKREKSKDRKTKPKEKDTAEEQERKSKKEEAKAREEADKAPVSDDSQAVIHLFFHEQGWLRSLLKQHDVPASDNAVKYIKW